MGLNTLTDARRLEPNDIKKVSAESQELTNLEISTDGALITSTGYELVSSVAGSGGCKNLLNYEKDADNRYLIITHGTNHYSITPTVSAWSTTNLGSYGTEATMVGSTVYAAQGGTRKAILGNDISGNDTKKADITNPMATAGTGAPDGYIMCTFMGRLFTATGRVLSYSAIDDETAALSGTIGFNDIIVALMPEGNRLNVFTRTYNQSVIWNYDDTFNLSVPLKEPREREYGAHSHKAITVRGSNVRYWADDNHVYDLGAELSYNENGQPRPVPLSMKIDPSINAASLNYKQKAVAVQVRSKKQWWLAVPYGTSQYNSLVFVYNENFRSWSTRYGFYPADFAIFRDSNYIPQLYFCDALSPSLYKFNNDYNYNGSGYLRRWKSKKFTMGTQMGMKKWKWIDISGSMYATTSFIVRIKSDNTYKEYTIDNTHLQTDAFGEYIGDDFIGHALIGGSEPSESAFKRFKARIDIDKDIREGYELELMIYNDEPDQPWKIDEIGIEFDYLPVTYIRQNFLNNNPNP
jgi:hypothetical protein